MITIRLPELIFIGDVFWVPEPFVVNGGRPVNSDVLPQGQVDNLFRTELFSRFDHHFSDQAVGLHVLEEGVFRELETDFAPFGIKDLFP